jgi:Lrp/AsnC family transcriptional regulator, leucine-responsive regulatory protein
MDTFDLKVIEILMGNSRIKWADLAAEIGLSAPATAERVNRLVEQGVIKNFGVMIDAESVGCECTAFVAVSLDRPDSRAPFLNLINRLDEVQECHHIAGDDDYLLKIRCRNIKDLDRIISNNVKSLHGVLRTRTTIVMDTLKESNQMALQSNKFSMD